MMRKRHYATVQIVARPLLGKSWEDVVRDSLTMANRFDFPVALECSHPRGTYTFCVLPGKSLAETWRSFEELREAMNR